MVAGYLPHRSEDMISLLIRPLLWRNLNPVRDLWDSTCNKHDRSRGRLRGVDAVIDKDLASAVLARDIGAELLVLLTDVRKVALDFQKPSQVNLDSMTIAEAERHLAAGHFPPGTMGPKVEGAIQFVRAGGERAIITTPDALPAALEGSDGTHIVA